MSSFACKYPQICFIASLLAISCTKQTPKANPNGSNPSPAHYSRNEPVQLAKAHSLLVFDLETATSTNIKKIADIKKGPFSLGLGISRRTGEVQIVVLPRPKKSLGLVKKGKNKNQQSNSNQNKKKNPDRQNEETKQSQESTNQERQKILESRDENRSHLKFGKIILKVIRDQGSSTTDVAKIDMPDVVNLNAQERATEWTKEGDIQVNSVLDKDLMRKSIVFERVDPKSKATSSREVYKNPEALPIFLKDARNPQNMVLALETFRQIVELDFTSQFVVPEGHVKGNPIWSRDILREHADGTLETERYGLMAYSDLEVLAENDGIYTRKALKEILMYKITAKIPDPFEDNELVLDIDYRLVQSEHVYEFDTLVTNFLDSKALTKTNESLLDITKDTTDQTRRQEAQRLYDRHLQMVDLLLKPQKIDDDSIAKLNRLRVTAVEAATTKLAESGNNIDAESLKRLIDTHFYNLQKENPVRIDGQGVLVNENGAIIDLVNLPDQQADLMELQN